MQKSPIRYYQIATNEGQPLDNDAFSLDDAGKLAVSHTVIPTSQLWKTGCFLKEAKGSVDLTAAGLEDGFVGFDPG